MAVVLRLLWLRHDPGRDSPTSRGGGAKGGAKAGARGLALERTAARTAALYRDVRQGAGWRGAPET